ncbi:hypothetical protein AVEN_49411-1 [Araneus ventricosus]|uniref:Uncharacterized protein n=1 Tax=Araneus ventricosus TaxID=182803 RepID=A0A4Y2CNT9_ARAVE|nr:hypothetical protein AVEN_49411-1 [Araneus ventricosus]
MTTEAQKAFLVRLVLIPLVILGLENSGFSLVGFFSFKSTSLEATPRLFRTDFVILNRNQMTRMTSEPAPPLAGVEVSKGWCRLRSRFIAMIQNDEVCPKIAIV